MFSVHCPADFIQWCRTTNQGQGAARLKSLSSLPKHIKSASVMTSRPIIYQTL
jgi:hypothetical protein